MTDSYDPAERVSRKVRAQQQRDEATRRTVIQTLMTTMQGRRYIWLELERAHVFHSTFKAGEDGSRISAFAEGERNYGIRLLADVTKYCAAQFTLMLTENASVKIEENEDERSTDS